MPEQVVMVVFRYQAATPEAAEAAIREVEERYEGKSIVTAASSLSELPHPSQLSEAREAFGE